MNTEYEAKFINIDKDSIRKTLKNVGAELIKPEFLQKRIVFDLPKGQNRDRAWVRVRDECDKITMSFKSVTGDKINHQKEICIEINDFSQAEKFLISTGCKEKSYIENKRELWKLGDVEITIDEWPFLDPFLEIEGKSEEAIRSTSQKLGFDYSKAIFGATDIIAQKKYGLSLDEINKIPKIVFDMENPFLKKD